MDEEAPRMERAPEDLTAAHALFVIVVLGIIYWAAILFLIISAGFWLLQ